MPRCANRVNEFVKRGLNVEVYYFERPLYKNEVKKINAPMHCLGELESGESSYWGRMCFQYKSVKETVNQYKSTKTIIYLFGFDLALLYYFSKSKLPYIFEESDLRHTYMKPTILSKFLEKLDKRIIRKSLLTVFTSEGFYKYHFKNEKLDNCSIIPNRLDPEILNIEYGKAIKDKVYNPEKMRIGFVGSIRFKSVFNFVDVYCRTFPHCEFHFYGTPILDNIEVLDKYPNCHFHGAFSSPRDLPQIYSGIDLVLSTYDTSFENALFAEPNKMYESMFFEVPIIVSSGTFVAEKVKELGIGYDVNAMNDEEVIRLIDEISKKGIEEKKSNIKKIPQKELVSINDSFFVLLDQKLSEHE